MNQTSLLYNYRNFNLDHLSTLYNNELEIKDKKIESLKKELYEINKKLDNIQNQKELLQLENQKIKEIYSSYNNKLKEENKIDKFNNDDDKKKRNMFKNEIKNRLLLKACNFYNRINNNFEYDNKNLINIKQYNNENLNNDINSLYELENKLQLIENNIFKTDKNF